MTAWPQPILGPVNPALPHDERQRLGDLCALGVLDTLSDPAFDRITRLAQRLFGVPISLVSFVDADRQWFKSRQGLDVSETPRDQAFCAHALHSDGVFVVENATEDPRFLANPLVTGPPHIRFYAGAPIHSPGGHRLGTLCIIDTQPRSRPTTDELATLSDLAAIVDQEIAQLAMGATDLLTGVHNRRGFKSAAEHILAAATRSNEPVVLVYGDMDGLKRINDQYGHGSGDAAIAATARLLKANLRGADVVARIGGDEFVALLYGASTESVKVALERVDQALDEHNELGDLPFPLSLTMGCVERAAGESVTDLLDRADRIMYEAKST